MVLLNHFNIAFGQLIPNLWRIVISCMEIWLAIIEGDMIRVDRFTYLYCLKESKEYGYYKLVPWVRKASVRTYVFHMLRTYVMILCNWLIL